MREVEAKFRVGPSFALPDVVADVPVVAEVAAPTRVRLRADYYDTSDLRLARDGVTLRRRVGGDDEGWHLKLPDVASAGSSGAVARDELHLPLLDNDELPPGFRELVTAWARRAPLTLVSTLLTDRTSYLLCGDDRRPLAEVCVDEVAVLDGDRETGRFREVEVEDRGGGAEALSAVANVLLAHGAVAGGPEPKVVRALGAAAAAEPDVPRPHGVTSDEAAYVAIAAIVRRHVRALLVQDARVRRQLDDAVHQMRVSARRLRSALRTLRPLLDVDWAEGLRAELAWLGSALGQARDAEVLELRLLGCLDALPPELVLTGARKTIVGALGGRVAAGQAGALEAVRSDRYLDLLDRLVEAARLPLTTPAAAAPGSHALAALVSNAWRRLDRRATRASAEASDLRLHATRIAAKRARYAAEDAVPVLGKPARKLARAAEQVQVVLGEQHDAVVAAATTLELAHSPRVGRAAFTLGVLHERQVAAAEEARREFAGHWEKLRKQRHVDRLAR